MSTALPRRSPALVVAVLLSLAAAAAFAGSVSGKYMGNGKEAKLRFARVVPHEKFDGRTAWTVILSEKDAQSSKHPDMDAMFGELGDALVVSITEPGEIFSTQVCHQALGKAGFSSVGPIHLDRFAKSAGKLSGHLFTEKEQEFFGDRWSLDLEFSAELPGAKP